VHGERNLGDRTTKDFQFQPKTLLAASLLESVSHHIILLLTKLVTVSNDERLTSYVKNRGAFQIYGK